MLKREGSTNRRDGLVILESHNRYVVAMRKWEEDLREHWVALGKKSLAFLDEYPGSEHEAGMVWKTFQAQAETEDWDLLIRTAGESVKEADLEANPVRDHPRVEGDVVGSEALKNLLVKHPARQDA